MVDCIFGISEYYENLFLNSNYFIEKQGIILEQLNYYKLELNRVEIA